MNDNGPNLTPPYRHKKLPFLYCFAGAGATGKTTLAKELLLAAPDTHYHQSIVRQYYAQNGIGSEADFHTMDVDTRARFQIGLLRYYMVTLEAVLVRTTSPRVVCDRSVFDHVAYMLFGSGEMLSQNMWDAEIEPIMTEFCSLNPRVFHLPYPTGWPEETAVDGFRHRVFAKDYIVDSLIRRLLAEHGTEGGRTGVRLEFDTLCSSISAVERAKEVARYFEWEPHRVRVTVRVPSTIEGVGCSND